MWLVNVPGHPADESLGRVGFGSHGKPEGIVVVFVEEGPGCAGEALEGGAGEDADVEGCFGLAGWATDADFDLMIVVVGHSSGGVCCCC